MGNVQLNCDNNPYTGTITASLQAGLNDPDTRVVLGFAPALPDQDCCVVTLSGMTAASAQAVVGGKFVRTLRGDIDRNGLTTTGDASIIKPHFGEPAGAGNCQFDFDVNGAISTSDFSQVKPRFGNSAPECP